MSKLTFPQAGKPKEFNLEDCAKRIRANIKGEATARIGVGRELIKAKEHLPHGEFLPWIEAEFGFSDQTARNYMNAAKLADEHGPDVLKLPAKELYALGASQTPEATKSEAIEAITKGDTAAAKTALAKPKQAPKSKTVLHLAKHAESSAAGGAAVGAAVGAAPDECSIKGHMAVNMIRDALKDQFVDFFELYEAAGVHAFDAALRQFIESVGVHAHAA